MPRFVALTIGSTPDDLAWALDGFAQLVRRAGHEVEPAVLIATGLTVGTVGASEGLASQLNERIDPVARIVLTDHHEPALRCAQYRAANVLVAPSLEPPLLRIVKQYVVSRVAGFGAVVVRCDTVESHLGAAAANDGVYACGPEPEQLARALLRAALAPPEECRGRMRVLRHELCHGVGVATNPR